MIVNNRLLAVPTVHSQITAGVSALSREDFSSEQIAEIANIIKAEMK